MFLEDFERGETRCVSTKILMIFIYMFESVIFESDILFILIFEIYLTKMQIKSINIFCLKFSVQSVV